jgi:glycosyltransferase involved in cell wall biosynthesis
MYDDGSSDESPEMMRRWRGAFETHGLLVKDSYADRQTSKPPPGQFNEGHGPAVARNRAVALSSGAFLCILDADDVMLPRRIELQLAEARVHPHALIGCQFIRDPPGMLEAQKGGN